MKKTSAWLYVALWGVAGTFSFSGQASAALVLNEQTLAGTTGSAVTTSFANPTNMLSTPSSTIYGNTFNAAQSTFSVADTAGTTSWGFYDDYFINITGSTANTIASTINLGSLLGISNLEVRLYSGSGTVLGSPGASLIAGWSTAINPVQGVTGTVSVINPTVLNAGSYVLEVRGIASGSAGGSYSGVFNLSAAPVPVPAAVYLLGSGMIGVLGLSRRGKMKALS